MGSDARTHVPIVARLGYNGELHEPASGWQFLGSGHRLYSNTLMRFNRPDEWSPFGRGGINPYAYCGTDPINYADPDGRGHFKIMALAVIFTGLTGALGGAKGLVHPEDKTTQTVLNIAIIASGSTAASIGGTYFFLKARKYIAARAAEKAANAKATTAPLVADTVPAAVGATAPPLTPNGAMPSPGPAPRVTFTEPGPPAMIPSQSAVWNPRSSAPGQGHHERLRTAPQGRPQAPVAALSTAPPHPVAAVNKAVRRVSLVVAGPRRGRIKAGGKAGKALKAASIRKQSTTSYINSAF